MKMLQVEVRDTKNNKFKSRLKEKQQLRQLLFDKDSEEKDAEEQEPKEDDSEEQSVDLNESSSDGAEEQK